MNAWRPESAALTEVTSWAKKIPSFSLKAAWIPFHPLRIRQDESGSSIRLGEVDRISTTFPTIGGWRVPQLHQDLLIFLIIKKGDERRPCQKA